MKKKPTLDQMVEAAHAAGVKVTTNLVPKHLGSKVAINRALEIQRTIEHGLLNGAFSVETVLLLVRATIVTLEQTEHENPS